MQLYFYSDNSSVWLYVIDYFRYPNKIDKRKHHLKMHPCPQCLGLYSTIEELQYHIYQLHKMDKYICKCGYKTNRNYNYERHIKVIYIV